MSSIKNANIEILNQLKKVLVQFEKNQYQKSLSLLNGISIGQHVRHIIEFYQCLFDGQISGIVNYDTRKRDLRIEADLNYALLLIETFKNKIQEAAIQNSLKLEVAFDFEQTSHVATSADRELTYLIEHTIHHLAILNIAIRAIFPKIIIPENFGVAFSTIQHNNKSNLTA